MREFSSLRETSRVISISRSSLLMYDNSNYIWDEMISLDLLLTNYKFNLLSP